MEYRKNDTREVIINELEKNNINDFYPPCHSDKVLKTALFFAEELNFPGYIFDVYEYNEEDEVPQEKLDKLVAFEFTLWRTVDQDEMLSGGPISEPDVKIYIYASGKWRVEFFEPVNDILSQQGFIDSDRLIENYQNEDDMMRATADYIFAMMIDY